DSRNSIDIPKLLLEGCATLTARSHYMGAFATDQDLRWLPLVYCAGQFIEIILMWYNPENQLYEYARVRPTEQTAARFDIRQSQLLIELHKIMYGLAQDLLGPMRATTEASLDANKLIDFTRLSSERPKSQRSKEPENGDQ